MAETSIQNRKPRILIVTPEITYLPTGMGNMANQMTAKAGGLADVSASLVSKLYDLGADVHVALPHYRQMFHIDVGKLISEELRIYQSKLPNARIHLAEDRIFYYRNRVYSNIEQENPKIAMAFQREVINNIIPHVKPDLIHCNDWMTGLIPAYARRLDIPCLFTVHNIHSHRVTLAEIEDRGIDAAEFWLYLYFMRVPHNYEETRSTNSVCMLNSGIFGAHFINTVSPSFLNEIAGGWHDFIPPHIRAEISNKRNADCASGILNAPDPTYNPQTDNALSPKFGPADHREAKRANKAEFQRQTGLAQNPNAPIFFWPSRLDPVQKGCQLLSDILYRVVSDYWNDSLQIAFVANGNYQQVFRNIVNFHGFQDRVAVCDFSEDLSRLGYAASDFMLMPSLFEPCGLPQMISCLYGSLPVVRDTGGLHDTVRHMRADAHEGNGFAFETYDAGGLRWAMDQAMAFHRLPPDTRAAEVERVMRESARTFTHDVCARHYIDLYERMLRRPIVKIFA
jgi:starch synthase